MHGQTHTEIARFSPAAAFAAHASSLAIGALLIATALAFAFTLLTSELMGRATLTAPIMLVVFAVACACVFGRGLVDMARSGPAVVAEDGRLKAFTVGFAEMPLSEIVHVKVAGRGFSRRVIVFGERGPRLVIRADLMKPDARSIANGIMAAKHLD